MTSAFLRHRIVDVVGDITKQDVDIMNAGSAFLDGAEFE
jgi:hypothetical protein